MEWHGPPQPSVNNRVLQLPTNDLRHRITPYRFPTSGPQNYEHVQQLPFTQWDSTHRPTQCAQDPTPSESGLLHVNVGPFRGTVKNGDGSPPTNTSYSDKRTRHRSLSPRRRGSPSGHGRLSQSSRCRKRSPRDSASRGRGRSRSPYFSRSRSRSPCKSSSRSRSPRYSPRRKGFWRYSSPTSPRRPPWSRESSSPVSSRSSPMSSRSVSRAPSNVSKSPVLILRYFGVKVMNLPSDGSLLEVETRVHKLFRGFGSVVSTVTSDAADGRFAVVMYQTAEGQARAVEVSGEPILGKPMKVIALSSDITRNCFGVKVTCPTEGLRDHVLRKVNDLFRMLGVVVCIKLYNSQKGRFAVVKFEKQVEQTNALQVSGTRELGHAVRVLGHVAKVTALKARSSNHVAVDNDCKKTRSKIHQDTERNLRLHPSNDKNISQSSAKDYESPKDLSEEMDRCQPTKTRMLFVRNLDTNITADDLFNTFGRFGSIVDIYVNNLPGATHNFAFVQFGLTHSVTGAIQAMNGAFLGKCQIVLGYGVIQPSRCVCVEGLSSSLSNEYVIQRFGEHGAIEKLLHDKARGIALILYTEERASQKAVNTSRNLKITGETINVDYANESFQLHLCRYLLSGKPLGSLHRLWKLACKSRTQNIT